MFNNSLEKINLLYIDKDNEENNNLFMLLNQRFDSITFCSQNSNPIEQFNLCDPDIVLINIDIPEVNSVSVIEKIREIDADIPILVITSEANRAKCVDTILLNINNYVSEPVDADSLISKLTYYAKGLFCEVEKNDYAKILQNVINSDKNLLIATNGERILFSNKTFLEFFKVSNHHEFVEKYHDLYGVFEEDDEFLHEGLIKNNETFLDLVLRTEETKRVVKMFDYKDYTFKAFYLNAYIISQKNNETTLLLTFTDITKIALENIGMQQKAYFDGLTNVYNRNKISEVLDYEIRQTKRYNETFCFVILDIDDFKLVNDKYGHLVGDEFLILLAQSINNRIRETDVFARWGGEEFVILLPNTNLDEAYIVAEDLRQQVLNIKHNKLQNISASFGITMFKNSDTQETLFKRADKALYKAKDQGKNKIEILE